MDHLWKFMDHFHIFMAHHGPSLQVQLQGAAPRLSRDSPAEAAPRTPWRLRSWAPNADSLQQLQKHVEDS